MDTSIWLWVGFNAFVLLLLAWDLGVLHKESREIGVAEALKLSAAYIGMALVFNAGLYLWMGPEPALQFLTGYLIEKSLSLDNVFVITLIFAALGTPAQYRHRVLFWGILGALVMRAALIFTGSALVMEFRWIVYLFGAFLLITGIKMLLTAGEAPDLSQSRLLGFLRRRLNVTEKYHADKFVVRRDGRRWATPLLLALVMVEATDLVFAVDSIPAIFAITTDPFIVYTSNVFAILGLRALYFALAGVIDRFVYLKYGLSLVLVLVGTKMMLIDLWKMPTLLTLALTVTILGGSVGLSLLRTRARAPAQA